MLCSFSPKTFIDLVWDLAAMDRRFRLARVWSNQELKKFGDLFEGEIVNVSAGDNVDKEGGTYDAYFPNKSSWYMTNYQPGSFRGFSGKPNEFLVDLTEELPIELRRRFDVAFNHTTLEHVFDVRSAMRNICEMSRDIVIVVVPFCQIQHENSSYEDFWRFTPTCIRALFQENGFTTIYESESHYRDAAIYLFFIAGRSPEKWQHKINAARLEVCGKWIGERGLVSRLLSRVFPKGSNQ